MQTFACIWKIYMQKAKITPSLMMALPNSPTTNVKYQFYGANLLLLFIQFAFASSLLLYFNHFHSSIPFCLLLSSPRPHTFLSYARFSYGNFLIRDSSAVSKCKYIYMLYIFFCSRRQFRNSTTH